VPFEQLSVEIFETDVLGTSIGSPDPERIGVVQPT